MSFLARSDWGCAKLRWITVNVLATCAWSVLRVEIQVLLHVGIVVDLIAAVLVLEGNERLLVLGLLSRGLV